MPELEPVPKGKLVTAQCGKLICEGCVFAIQTFPHVSVPEVLTCGTTACQAVVVMTPMTEARPAGICGQTTQPAAYLPQTGTDQLASYLEAIAQGFA
jgi:hypothetical protein